MKRLKARGRSRRGASEIIGVVAIILVLIAVMAAILLNGFVMGLLGIFGHRGASTLVTAGGSVTVPGSAGLGEFDLTVISYDSSPIVAIAIINAPTNPLGFQVLANGNAFGPGATFPMDMAQLPLSSNEATSQQFSLEGAQAGMAYTFYLNCTLEGGGNNFLSVTVNSQV